MMSPASSAKRTGSKRSKRKHDTTAFSAVTPVAIASGDDRSQAVIPVAIKTTADSPDPQAMIPVQVKTARGKTAKRAALMPVAVKRASKPARAAKRSRVRAKRKPASGSVIAFKPAETRPDGRQRDVVTRTAVALTTAEETAVNLAGNLAVTVSHAVPRLVRSVLGRVAQNTRDGALTVKAKAEDAAEAVAA